MRLLTSLCALSLTLGVTAQQSTGRVDPALFEWFSTTAETGFPFGYPTRSKAHVLEVHDGMRGKPSTIQSIAIRRAPGQTSLVPAFDAKLQLRLSTAVTTAATMSADFAQNEGLDAVTVVPMQQISFPATQGPYTGPAPFEYVIPLQTPFAFAANGPLCMDLKVDGHTNSQAMRFALYESERPHMASFGTACGALSLSTQSTGNVAIHSVQGAPIGAPVLLLLGFDFKSLFGSALPIDLTPMGAPGCLLEVQPLVDLHGFADASGSISFQIPLQNAAAGDYYASQAATIQPGLNALGVELSSADLIAPITPRIAGRVWNEDLNASSGVLQPVFALVLEIR